MRPTEFNQYRTIERFLEDAGLRRDIVTRQTLIRADTDKNDEEFQEWTLSTELPVDVWDWDRFEVVREVLLADGMMVPASRKVPLLDSHRRHSSHDVLGHVRDFDTVTVDEYAGRSGKCFFAADEASQIIRQKVIDGHITDGSVGYQVLRAFWVPEDMTVNIAGKDYTGPLKVSTEWSLKEFSITPIGADVLAKVRNMCGGNIRQ